MARCSKQAPGYVEFVTTEVQKELDPNKVHKEAATYVEFYARGDLKTYSSTERPMVLLPVRCISGFLGTCVTMESFSNAYGGQTGNNYQICSHINGVPTNIPFAGEWSIAQPHRRAVLQPVSRSGHKTIHRPDLPRVPRHQLLGRLPQRAGPEQGRSSKESSCGHYRSVGHPQRGLFQVWQEKKWACNCRRVVQLHRLGR